MKKVKIENSIGLPLGADITEVIPGKAKRAVFKRGHIIEASDLEALKSVGKDYIWIYEENKGFIHEDEAALRIANSLIDESLYVQGPNEGWAYIRAGSCGIFKADKKAIERVNRFDLSILITIDDFSLVSKDKEVARCKISPVEIKENLLKKIENVGCALQKEKKSMLQIHKPLIEKIGLIITGTEIYKGLVKDAAYEKVKEKIEPYGAQIIYKKIVPDDKNEIKKAIEEALGNNSELIILTGGMGPDPDDTTRGGIKRAGAKIIKYGIPINPATMSLIGYIDEIPLVGVSAGSLYFKKTFLDFVLPRIFIKAELTKKEVISWGPGGLLKQD